jgi:hypothetical protein
MMAARPFPFGHEPAHLKTEQTAPRPQPAPQKTELLLGFKPPAQILPFQAPLSTILPPAPPHPLVPALPPRRVPTRAPLSSRHVVALILLMLVFDIAVLLHLAVTRRP